MGAQVPPIQHVYIEINLLLPCCVLCIFRLSKCPHRTLSGHNRSLRSPVFSCFSFTTSSSHPGSDQAPWLSHLYSCSPLFCLNYCNGMVQGTHSLCGNSLPPLLGAQNTFPFIFISLQGGYVTSPSPALASCAPSGLDPGHLGWELFAYIAVSCETRNFAGARRTFC